MSSKKKVAFTTLGCKLNFSETSGIAKQFEDAGYERTEVSDIADIYVINTCTVTELANKKSKQAIKRLTKQNPEAKIVVVGCYSQLKPNEVSSIEGVDLVMGSEGKFDIINKLSLVKKGDPAKVFINDAGTEKSFTPSYSFGDRTRSFLKVQDGCDYFCSYCAIPYARGRSRNNSITETVKKASEIVANGVKEIILTGVNIGDFGKASKESFFGLLKELVKVEGLERLRISSIEPNLLTNEIIEFAAQSTVVVPHFHIPLQCGTDNLLRAMRRRYTTALYKKRVDKIKELMPHACIAADIIVGVPGETDEEFNATLDFIKDLNISYLHIFTYSERENTLAVRMENQVAIPDRKERSKIMHELANRKQQVFQNQHLETTREVLFEGQSNSGKISGFTDNYIRVEVPFNPALINTIKQVKLLRTETTGNVSGELI
jgi:threonylcarbamoyladenosine tRNA methylthiotransferase MtaB